MGTRTHRVGHGDAEELVARPRCSSDSLHPNASGEQAAVSIDWLRCERCRERQAQTAMWCMVMAASCGAIDGDAASQLGLADNASARNRRRHVPSTCPCPHPTMSLHSNVTRNNLGISLVASDDFDHTRTFQHGRERRVRSPRTPGALLA